VIPKIRSRHPNAKREPWQSNLFGGCCGYGGDIVGSEWVLSISDSPAAWTVAERKTREIELDMLSGNFDCSLKKYSNSIY